MLAWLPPGPFPRKAPLRHHGPAVRSGAAQTNSRGSSVHLSIHTAASLAPLPPADMAPAGVSAILILTALLSAAAAPHKPTAPPSLANATMPWWGLERNPHHPAPLPQLLGMWQYVAGAAQLPQHLLELLLIDHGHLHVEPSSGQELLITQHVAVGDRCLSNNSTSVHLGANGTALLKDARNRTVSSTQQDELGQHAESLGLSRGAVVYAPWRKELCQPGEKERMEERKDGGAQGTALPSTPAGSRQQ
ncbi:uncharacterized protein LOC104913666 isoform X3 [Meleagris gallopavo]|uniref:uncharacterized protein LOC104913666 isoform X3 n=1 Tax=Meleagris gallopavo TaxID=9103 RepID=UPI0012AB41A2|nr:uncharacterized protein LOC104913666 isoform X3 [Meleagris gallopavo]